MTYSVIDFLSDQLKAAAPHAEWVMTGVDRSRELAQILERAGIRDLSILELLPIEQTHKRAAWTPEENLPGYSFRYKGELIGFMGTPDRRDTLKVLGDSGDPFAVAWSAAGKGHVMYRVAPAPGGFAIVPSWGSSSDWGTFREVVKVLGSFVLMFALPVAGFAVASTVGAAIVGPTLATTYPLLAQVVGSIALSTAFNGGDVEKAVKGAALSMVGAEIGSLANAGATAVTDVALLGKLADSGVRAFIQGGDMEKAIAFTLIRNGGDLMDFGDFNNNQATFETPAFGSDFVVSTSPLDPFAFSGAYSQPGGPVDQSNFGFDFQPLIDPATGFNIPVSIEPPRPAAVDSSWFTKDTVNAASSAALTALQLVKAYQQNGAQGVLTQARARTESGTVSALDTGVVQTRDANGVLVNKRPPVGIAQSTITGNVMVNNGDGTYSLIDRAGNVRVIKYGSESAGGFDLGSFFGSVSPAVWIGGAGVALALLKFSKRG
jgi:hypothetical protein